jgi:hypothetical protein
MNIGEIVLEVESLLEHDQVEESPQDEPLRVASVNAQDEGNPVPEALRSH